MNAQTNTASGTESGLTEAWDRLCSASQLADLVTDLIVVVDGRFRIVCANKAFRSAFTHAANEAFLGHSFGEIAECRYADGERGCGDLTACAECGWFQAVGACRREGCGEQECRILRRNGSALDFAVTVAPAANRAFFLCGLKDLFAAKRLRVLERSFFHDVTNLAAGIRGLCELEQDADGGQGDELRLLIHDGANKLVDEIERLRSLRVAENGDLHLCRSEVAPGVILRAVKERFMEDASARHLEVLVEEETAPLAFETDKDLLISVFGEFVRNAIEASGRGDRVTLRCSSQDGRIIFSVQNAAALDGNIQAHVFERSFSSRGPGRGVGTYRAKLIVERYFMGTVGFVSEAGSGTTFYASLPLIVPGSTI